MYKVRFIPYRRELGAIYHRQTLGHRLCSRDGRYQFFVEEDISDPDFLVVQGKGLRETAIFHVAPENTIFMATEPQSVLVYPHRYLAQFGQVCTCQHPTRHPHVHYGPAILPWFVGYTEKDGVCDFSIDRDMLERSPVPKKDKLLSVITSNKAFTRGHIYRIRFVERLKEHFGDQVDIFGRGFRPFADKWDVLAPYRYHIAIENSSQRYYWTEKISDCYLAGTFPFYYGCTNLGDYFPREAFAAIDIRNADEAIRVIEQEIRSNRFGMTHEALAESKRRVLQEYDLFEYTARLCDFLHPDAPKKDVTLHPCRSTDDWHNLYNYTIRNNYYKWLTKWRGVRI